MHKSGKGKGKCGGEGGSGNGALELHPSAHALLAEIDEKGGKTDIDSLEKVGFDHPEIIRFGLLLESSGLISIRRSKSSTLELTDKGQEVFVKGLPERRILDIMKYEKSKSIESLRDELELEEGEFNAGIGICKRYKWIELAEGKVKLMDYGEKVSEEALEAESALEDILKYGNTERNVEALIKRKLVRRVEKMELEFSITKEGKKALEKLSRGKVLISKLTPEIIKSGKWKSAKIRAYDVTAPAKTVYPGRSHPYIDFINYVKRKMVILGFTQFSSPLVDMEFWNFDVLFQAQDHPAREIHDRFEIKKPEYGIIKELDVAKRVGEAHEHGGNTGSEGWGYKWDIKKARRLILKSQNTAASARALASHSNSNVSVSVNVSVNVNVGYPLKIFTIDRVFRNDVMDRTHLIEFFQLEGIVVAQSGFKDLLGYLELFVREIANISEDRGGKMRFKPDYFPFTEPSVEVQAYTKDMGWMEIGGAGIFRPEVTKPLGVKDNVNVLAWGLGLERLAMLRLKIKDIRELVFPSDIEYIRKAEKVWV